MLRGLASNLPPTLKTSEDTVLGEGEVYQGWRPGRGSLLYCCASPEVRAGRYLGSYSLGEISGVLHPDPCAITSTFHILFKTCFGQEIANPAGWLEPVPSLQDPSSTARMVPHSKQPLEGRVLVFHTAG